MTATGRQVICDIRPTEVSVEWRPFENGTTIGQRGSEDGIIVLDDAHELGARITLERDCSHGIPFAVTCGVYGWFFHTRFLGSESEAEFLAMLDGLSAILDIIPRIDDPEADAKKVAVSESISRFVDRFP
jgi:hypothetical protein